MWGVNFCMLMVLLQARFGPSPHSQGSWAESLFNVGGVLAGSSNWASIEYGTGLG